MSPDWPFKAAEHNGYCCPNAQYIAVKLTIEEYEYAALAVKERDFLSKQVNELGSNLILMEFDKKQVEKELAELKEESERFRNDYLNACRTIALMHMRQRPEYTEKDPSVELLRMLKILGKNSTI